MNGYEDLGILKALRVFDSMQVSERRFVSKDLLVYIELGF